MITYDAAGSSSETAATTSITFSHTIGSGKNRVLLVGTHVEMGGNTENAVTGVTYGGVALTKIRHRYDNTNANAARVEMWSLLNPASGTANVVVSYAISVNRAFACSVSYSNVYQVAAINTSTDDVVSSASPSISITPTVTNTRIVGLFGIDGVASTVSGLGSSQVQRVSFTGGVAFNTHLSDKALVTPSATTMSLTLNSSSGVLMIAVALRPVAAGGGGFIFNML